MDKRIEFDKLWERIKDRPDLDKILDDMKKIGFGGPIVVTAGPWMTGEGAWLPGMRHKLDCVCERCKAANVNGWRKS